MKKMLLHALGCLLFCIGCTTTEPTIEKDLLPPTRMEFQIKYNQKELYATIEKREDKNVDVFLLFHGTVQSDSSIIEAANTTLNNFSKIIQRNDLFMISVAYPQENLLFGDNIEYAEAALLWVKNNAENELGITINKIFLGGHSQGGYIVTRLNTMHKTDGVIANAPGPLNLVYRCSLEENGTIQPGAVCAKLRNQYGTTSQNPTAYFNRSLLNFTKGYLADMLFVQGLNDAPIQMYSWPTFKQEVQNCSDCKKVEILDIPGGGHPSMFNDSLGMNAVNDFINKR